MNERQAKSVATRDSALGLTAMGIFLMFGAAMADLVAVTFLWPGTFLDRIWRLNLAAYRQLEPPGGKVGFSLPTAEPRSGSRCQRLV